MGLSSIWWKPWILQKEDKAIHRMYQYLVIGFISLLTLIPLILTYAMVSFLVYQGQCLTAFNKCLENLKNYWEKRELHCTFVPLRERLRRNTPNPFISVLPQFKQNRQINFFKLVKKSSYALSFQEFEALLGNNKRYYRQ